MPTTYFYTNLSLNLLVNHLHPLHDLRRNVVLEVFECCSSRPVAERPVLVVGLQAVVPSPLQVQGHQVHPGEGDLPVLEQVVGHLGGDGVVEHLDAAAQETPQHFVDGVSYG